MTTSAKDPNAPGQPVEPPKRYLKGSEMPQAEFDALAQDMAQAMVDSLAQYQPDEFDLIARGELPPRKPAPSK